MLLFSVRNLNYSYRSPGSFCLWEALKISSDLNKVVWVWQSGSFETLHTSLFIQYSFDLLVLIWSICCGTDTSKSTERLQSPAEYLPAWKSYFHGSISAGMSSLPTVSAKDRRFLLQSSWTLHTSRWKDFKISKLEGRRSSTSKLIQTWWLGQKALMRVLICEGNALVLPQKVTSTPQSQWISLVPCISRLNFIKMSAFDKS